MNRFRTKKKTKEGSESIGRPSTETDQSPMPAVVKSSKTFRRGKKPQEPEPKPEIDLATVLPSTDDFRTSLLMSGLSARFSMLREQDDPTSKIGKASDDSVLFPKRQSRLNGFDVHGLSDIAEVSSINGSIRPPFAFSRTDSYHEASDADSAHSGSMMSRAKPGEGNNLFGGRQKISMGNRILYDNDVSQSAYQKLREREREQKEQDRLNQEAQELVSSRPNSPPLYGYNQNRETSSTTSSAGPSLTRTSTAATSFTSQRTPSLSGSHTPVTPNMPGSINGGLDRSLTKTRRLYETGLDNHLHEQQFSAMKRIDSITKQRPFGTNTPPPGMSPTFTNNPPERWDRQQMIGKQSMPNLRAASPPLSGPAMGTFDFGVKSTNNTEMKPYAMASPPLSPPMTEYDEQSVLPVQPGDRGKATALGAFTKPTPYDDNKYSQRQLQMQQGRETPPAIRPPPPQGFIPRPQAQQPTGRTRGESSSSTSLETSSRSNFLAAQRAFAGQEHNESPRNKIVIPSPQPLAPGTFLISSDRSSIFIPSDVGTEPKVKTHPKPLDLSTMYRHDQMGRLERPQDSQHPANRARPFLPESTQVTSRSSPNLSSLNPSLQSKEQASTSQQADSPTLGPSSTPSAGLSGMVRQHLRSDSNTSSNYGGEGSIYNSPSRFPAEHSEPIPQNAYSTKNNPWENDDWEQNYYDETAQTEGSNTNIQGIDTLPSLSVKSPVNDTPVLEPPVPSWEKEMGARHAREGSSETAKERKDFKEELAERRRRVRENLKSFAESDRTVSPQSGADWSRDGVPTKGNALGLLKTKASAGSLTPRSKEPSQTKAMKMLGLGLGNATISSSPSPGKSSFDDNPWKREEEEMVRGVAAPSPPAPTKAFRQARRDAQRDRERQVAMRHQQKIRAETREAEDQDWQDQRRENIIRPSEEQDYDRFEPNLRGGRATTRDRRPPPVNYAKRAGSQESSETSRSASRPPSTSSRDRSESDTSAAPSKGRNGLYKDDLAEAMAKGTSSSTQSYYEDLDIPSQRLMAKSPGAAPSPYHQHSPMPSPMTGAGTRSRGNSKSTPAGYFDPEKLQHLQSGPEGFEIGAPPRPSPTAPFVVNATPSTAVSPVAVAYMPPRKRSINKSEISEPKFLHSTSRMTTVDLPPGASLRNGVDLNTPPIPPVNPRRRQTRAMFGLGRKDELDNLAELPAASHSSEEMSTFSADEGEDKPRLRHKLRKSSSEGGMMMTARAKALISTAPSPAVPNFPPSSPPKVEGGMF